MEGYFNFGFTNSIRKSSAWFLSQRATESNYKIDVEWSCDSVERNSMEDVDTIDTDLDSDSFLSDLERDSGEQRGEAGERSQRYSHRDWEEAVQRTNNHSQERQGSQGRQESQERQERQERQEGQEGQEGKEVRRGERLGGSLSQVRAGKPGVETGGESCCCCYFTLLDISCITGLLSLSALVFSLIAPDWVTNTEPHQSSLIRLNPWDICLSRLQANSSPAGCYSSWDLEVAVMPAWFLVVPATLLLVSSLSLSARALLFLIWFKKRQIFPLKLGVKLMVTCVVMDYLSGLGLLVSTMMFAASVLSSPSLATSTSAINLSWGWAASLISSWGHVATATLVARSTHRERKKRAQNENFIRNIQA